MGKHIGTGGLARGKILGGLAFYTWVGRRGATITAEKCLSFSSLHLHHLAYLNTRHNRSHKSTLNMQTTSFLSGISSHLHHLVEAGSRVKKIS